ncbi:MAG: response regulator transcription factor [Candidatus Omnitrophica bacterium]|nr:response regulator transcription factor [Candidatus Omnitrophota bacterium]
MAQESILIVEDDQNIAKLVRYNFEKAGYRVFVTITGEDALDHLSRHMVDLIILDLMLPKMDGFETCRRLKDTTRLSSIPVMILTARGEEVDRVVGFELGADDYVVKPFSPRELVLRAKTILRRGQARQKPKENLSYGDITIDIPRHRISVKGKEIIVTPMEFKLLIILVERRGRVQSREQLLSDVWNIEADVTTRTVDTHVKRLRQKLGKAGNVIETIRGLGYRLSDDEE